MDTDTFNNDDVISFCTENFINLKINTDTDYGYQIYKKFNITSLPTVLFLDSHGNKKDMIIGYHTPKDYLEKIRQIRDIFNPPYNQ